MFVQQASHNRKVRYGPRHHRTFVNNKRISNFYVSTFRMQEINFVRGDFSVYDRVVICRCPGTKCQVGRWPRMLQYQCTESGNKRNIFPSQAASSHVSVPFSNVAPSNTNRKDNIKWVFFSPAIMPVRCHFLQTLLANVRRTPIWIIIISEGINCT